MTYTPLSVQIVRGFDEYSRGKGKTQDLRHVPNGGRYEARVYRDGEREGVFSDQPIESLRATLERLQGQGLIGGAEYRIYLREVPSEKPLAPTYIRTQRAALEAVWGEED